MKTIRTLQLHYTNPQTVVMPKKLEILGVAAQLDPATANIKPRLVYVEDSGGRLQLLGRVSHGEVKLFEAPTDVTELGDFRVKVYPISIPDPWSRSNDPGIKTHALNLQNGEMVILWIARELTASSVEVRAG